MGDIVHLMKLYRSVDLDEIEVETLEETVRETKAPTPPEPQEEMPMDEQSPDGLMTRRV